MIADFYPWKIDVDIEATKQFYDENDWSEDRAANQKFCDVMTQWNLYNDEEIVGMRLPETLEVVEMPEGEKLPVYDIDGWGCVFKHPFFRMEEKRFKQWDCGYVLGSILLMKDI